MTAKSRVRTHRTRMESRGLRRMEISIPVEDAERLVRLAKALREPGESAGRLRTAIDMALPVAPPKTGADLLRILEAAPVDITPYLEPREIEPERPNPFD